MDAVWTSSPKGTWAKAQKAQNNKFVEMSWKIGFKWIKWQVNRSWSQRKGDNKFLMRKNVLGKVWGDWFLYICLSSIISSLVLDYYNVSFLIFWSLPHGGSLTLYSSLWIILILHLLIIWALIWVSVPSDTLFGFLWIVVANAALFMGLLHINAARKVASVHLMQW